jgi:hypothetical protein
VYIYIYMYIFIYLFTAMSNFTQYTMLGACQNKCYSTRDVIARRVTRFTVILKKNSVDDEIYY